jgi:hypothetical protein
MSLFAQWKVWVFGFLSWLVPFVAAFAFYDASGTLVIAQPLFKSLMVVIGGMVGVGLLVLVFRQTGASVAAGLAIGVLWLAINLILDFLVLVPMSGMGATDYLLDIGLRYLLLPIIAVGMGAVAQRGT